MARISVKKTPNGKSKMTITGDKKPVKIKKDIVTEFIIGDFELKQNKVNCNNCGKLYMYQYHGMNKTTCEYCFLDTK